MQPDLEHIFKHKVNCGQNKKAKKIRNAETSATKAS